MPPSTQRDGTPIRKRRYAYSESFACIAFAAHHKATGSESSKGAIPFTMIVHFGFIHCRACSQGTGTVQVPQTSAAKALLHEHVTLAAAFLSNGTSLR
jgi:hypothetical protein